MITNYILAADGKTPVPCASLPEWVNARAVGTHVGDDTIGGVRISTVFLGIDHAFGGAIPIFFETMVFGGVLDQEQHRYSTWDEAEAGHRRLLDMVKDTLAAAFHPDFLSPEARS